MPVPTMTPEQRADALAKALAARQASSAALGDLAAGKVTLAAVLAGEDPRLQRAKVSRVLRALPGVGAVTADRMLAVAGIAGNRRVRGLGDVQRRRLAELASA